VQLLDNVGKLPTAEAIVRALEEGQYKNVGQTTLVKTATHALLRVAPEDFLKAVNVAQRLSAKLTPDTKGNNLRAEIYAALRNAAQEVSPEVLTAGLKAVTPDQRPTYANGLLFQLKKQPKAALLEALKIENPRTRENALNLLRQQDALDASLLPTIMELLADPDERVRAAAADAFRKTNQLDRSRSAALLEQFLAQAPTLERFREASWLIPDLTTADSVQLVEKLWEKATPEQKELLMDVVTTGNRVITTEAANRFLLKNFDMVPQNRKAGVITRFGNALFEPAIDLIGASLADPNAGIRDAARKAVDAFRQQREALEEFKRWKAGDAEARASIAELLKLLESPNPEVVIGSVRALGAVKAKSALPALVKLLDKPNPELKKAVQDAIARIGE
jgi:HEAT repeat protein